jgi:hypothetical protein
MNLFYKETKRYDPEAVGFVQLVLVIHLLFPVSQPAKDNPCFAR